MYDRVGVDMKRYIFIIHQIINPSNVMKTLELKPINSLMNNLRKKIVDRWLI
jgi:hypothetical protein